MIELTIDSRKVRINEGATILEAADKAGVSIPTMCFLKSCAPSTSCMVCVVKVNGSESLVPACAARAVDGMSVESESGQVRNARRTALELLLSDHAGDCMGPCHVTCPAKMDIPLMIRQIAAGDLKAAIKTVKQDIPLPAVLGRICPAPCEKSCRRRVYDQPVSICLLKRFVADIDLASEKPYLPEYTSDKNKTVAIIGAGICGLTAAYYLKEAGCDCTLYDKNKKPGGMLRYSVEEGVLDSEIAVIEKMGVKFKLGTNVGDDVEFTAIQKDYDAVLLATGVIDKDRFDTALPHVFAGSDDPQKRRMAITVVAAAKESAVSIAQFLDGSEITGSVKPFNSRMGNLQDGEINIFMQGITNSGRCEREDGNGFTDAQATGESLRCLKCDCRKPGNCKLRKYAQEYGARAGIYKSQRRKFQQQLAGDEIVYESGKCIDCGLCIQTVSKESKSLGLAFSGRGYGVKVKVPFGRSLKEGLGAAAKKCVKNCPTGALAFKHTLADGKFSPE